MAMLETEFNFLARTLLNDLEEIRKDLDISFVLCENIALSTEKNIKGCRLTKRQKRKIAARLLDAMSIAFYIRFNFGERFK